MIKNNELYCNHCGKFIPFDEKYVKNCLLYQESDWHQCLCMSCTLHWKKMKEIAETGFGKRVGYKMTCIDEL